MWTSGRWWWIIDDDDDGGDVDDDDVDVDGDDVEQEKDVKVCLSHAKRQVSAPKSTKRNQKEPIAKEITKMYHKLSQIITKHFR